MSKTSSLLLPTMCTTPILVSSNRAFDSDSRRCGAVVGCVISATASVVNPSSSSIEHGKSDAVWESLPMPKITTSKVPKSDTSCLTRSSSRSTSVLPAPKSIQLASVPFENLTNEIVTSWVKNAIGPEKVAEIENAVALKISEQKNPTSVTMQIA